MMVVNGVEIEGTSLYVRACMIEHHADSPFLDGLCGKIQDYVYAYCHWQFFPDIHIKMYNCTVYVDVFAKAYVFRGLHQRILAGEWIL